MHTDYKHGKYADDKCHCGSCPCCQKDSSCCNQHNKCNCKSKQRHHKHCVEDVLEDILKTQRKAKEADHCRSSCKDSINDLLGKKRRVTKNTIPIIIYCGCKPYKGTGVATYSCKSDKRFKCIQSHIFKIKGLKDNCAVLELLAFKSDLKFTSGSCKKSRNDVDPCRQIDNKCVNDLRRTGICINVDLSCFCSVTCLPAIYL